MEEIKLKLFTESFFSIRLGGQRHDQEIVLRADGIQFYEANVSTTALRVCNDFRTMLEMVTTANSRANATVTLQNYSGILGRGVECQIRGKFLEEVQRYINEMHGSFLMFNYACTGVKIREWPYPRTGWKRNMSSSSFVFNGQFTPESPGSDAGFCDTIGCVVPLDLIQQPVIQTMQLCVSVTARFAKSSRGQGVFHNLMSFSSEDY